MKTFKQLMVEMNSKWIVTYDQMEAPSSKPRRTGSPRSYGTMTVDAISMSDALKKAKIRLAGKRATNLKATPKDQVEEQNFDQEKIDRLIVEYTLLSSFDTTIYHLDAPLEEGVMQNLLHKAGLHAHKTSGLIDYLIKGGRGVGKLILAAMKKDKQGVKDILSSVDKTDVLDFLLKLDQATLHIVTGPIHFIDAVTGWHLWAEIKNKSSVAADAVKEFLAHLKRAKENLLKLFKGNAKLANNAKKNIEELEGYFG